MAADRIITGSVAVFCFHKCQTRDSTIYTIFFQHIFRKYICLSNRMLNSRISLLTKYKIMLFYNDLYLISGGNQNARFCICNQKVSTTSQK
jgi:hypothetical protein